MPRVIAGSARGIPLTAPRGPSTRPTGDRVKEALFSILMPRLPEASFLDLFAGTGQIGLEAASRGAGQVILVENASQCVPAIRENITKTRLTDKVTLMSADVFAAVQRLRHSGRKFDIIFLDPPYNRAYAMLSRLADGLQALLAPAGLLILEHDAKEEAQAFVTNLKLSRSCQYGTAMLSFYQL
jgi:16S rRNA (guanine966-N2)-methyltransferase